MLSFFCLDIPVLPSVELNRLENYVKNLEDDETASDEFMVCFIFYYNLFIIFFRHYKNMVMIYHTQRQNLM